MKLQGAWIILQRSIVVPLWIEWNMVEMFQDPKPTQCNKKISKKSCTNTENQEFRSPDSTFQLSFYGGNYTGSFWGLPIELARPDGAVTFTRLCKASTVSMHSFGCWEPRLSKKYRVDRGYHNISGSIFKSFKSRWLPGCTAARSIPWEFANRQLGDTDAWMYS